MVIEVLIYSRTVWITCIRTSSKASWTHCLAEVGFVPNVLGDTQIMIICNYVPEHPIACIWHNCFKLSESIHWSEEELFKDAKLGLEPWFSSCDMHNAHCVFVNFCRHNVLDQFGCQQRGQDDKKKQKIKQKRRLILAFYQKQKGVDSFLLQLYFVSFLLERFLKSEIALVLCIPRSSWSGEGALFMSAEQAYLIAGERDLVHLFPLNINLSIDRFLDSLYLSLYIDKSVKRLYNFSYLRDPAQKKALLHL